MRLLPSLEDLGVHDLHQRNIYLPRLEENILHQIYLHSSLPHQEMYFLVEVVFEPS
ncbi:hypothetical protein LguiB_005006 [Lonicera macranthoides]